MNRFCRVFFSVFFAVLIMLMLYLTFGLVTSIHSACERDVYTAQLSSCQASNVLHGEELCLPIQ